MTRERNRDVHTFISLSIQRYISLALISKENNHMTQQTDIQWQPATTPELGDSARPIQEHRGLIKLVVFSLLTLGFYGFYFVYKMAQDMNTMCEDDDEKTGGLIAYILLCFITLGVYSIIWYYKIANRVFINAPRYGFAVPEKGSTYPLWMIVGCFTFGIGALFAQHTVLKNVNTLARAYNRAHGF